jgi:hypothetical protein
MKKITIVIVSVMLLGVQLLFAQEEQNKSIHLETGFNLSLPVHIEMYRTHRIAIGINLRASKKISSKKEIGVRVEYDYRFARKTPAAITADVQERAKHRNFSLICVKPNIQFNFKSKWFMGAESGLGYAISDENNSIGMGFVSEYAEEQRFGSCSGLYFGKYFLIGPNKNRIGLSLNLTNFLSNGHAENTLGLKFNYCFKK